MFDVAVPQIGVGVFHAWLFRGGAGGWVSEVFVSTDARRVYPRGVIRSTVGAYPRGTGSNPVKGNGHFFLIPSALSFVFFWHTHTCRFSKLLFFSFSSVRMAVIDWWNGPLTLVVIFFALCLLLLTWSIAGVACRACHSSGTFFHCDTHTHTQTNILHAITSTVKSYAEEHQLGGAGLWSYLKMPIANAMFLFEKN